MEYDLGGKILPVRISHEERGRHAYGNLEDGRRVFIFGAAGKEGSQVLASFSLMGPRDVSHNPEGSFIAPYQGEDYSSLEPQDYFFYGALPCNVRNTCRPPSVADALWYFGFKELSYLLYFKGGSDPRLSYSNPSRTAKLNTNGEIGPEIKSRLIDPRKYIRLVLTDRVRELESIVEKIEGLTPIRVWPTSTEIVDIESQRTA